jgi:hypothetical protein
VDGAAARVEDLAVGTPADVSRKAPILVVQTHEQFQLELLCEIENVVGR